MSYTRKGDFYVFKNYSKDRLLAETQTFLEFHEDTKLLGNPTYDKINLEWVAVIMIKENPDLNKDPALDKE